MTKVFFISGLIIFGLIILVIVVLVITKPKTGKPSVPYIPTSSTLASPQGSIFPGYQSLIDYSKPQNNATNVKINAPINVHFTKNVDLSGASITFNPPIKFQTYYNNQNLDIILTDHLQTNTSYHLNISIPADNFSYDLSFTTGSDAVIGTEPGIAEVQSYENSVRQSNPSLYLSNKVPFSNDLFVITLGPFKTVPNSHYSFYVSFKGGNHQASRDSLKGWLESLGLTDSQIESLDIAYQ